MSYYKLSKLCDYYIIFFLFLLFFKKIKISWLKHDIIFLDSLYEYIHDIQDSPRDKMFQNCKLPVF